MNALDQLTDDFNAIFSRETEDSQDLSIALVHAICWDDYASNRILDGMVAAALRDIDPEPGAAAYVEGLLVESVTAWMESR